ncbi:MAG: IS1595 family transposase [Methyloligellaceae bacterium]
MSALNAPHFQNADEARKHLEGLLWGGEPVCPHCGSVDRAYKTKKVGVYRCAEPECRKDFTVTTGTVMERSRVPLHLWMQAFYLMASSKKGYSAHQLHRTLGVTYKTAWFMAHRIREAMRAGGLSVPPMGGPGKIVEADETYFGKVDKMNRRTTRTSGEPFIKKGKRGGPANKRPIISLVERGGNVRSFHVAVANKVNVTDIVRSNVDRETRLHTDESRLYQGSGEHFASHETVKHAAGEYARGDVNTNSVEGYFSIFKRGMRGVYQHCAEKHLHRYLAEFDFRYNARKISDGERAALALVGISGKRLTYRISD